MHFTRMWEYGILLDTVQGSTVERSEFDNNIFGVALAGNLTGTEDPEQRVHARHGVVRRRCLAPHFRWGSTGPRHTRP